MAVFGAGTAGVGIADQVVNAIESKLREQAAVNKMWYVPFLTLRHLPVTHHVNRLVDKPGLPSDKRHI